MKNQARVIPEGINQKVHKKLTLLDERRAPNSDLAQTPKEKQHGRDDS